MDIGNPRGLYLPNGAPQSLAYSISTGQLLIDIEDIRPGDNLGKPMVTFFLAINYFPWSEVRLCQNPRKVGFCISTNGGTDRIVARKDRSQISSLL